MNATTLIRIILLFSSLSILSIGGGNTVLPEMHPKSVNDYHWLTDSQFADIFAISQAAPGPSILIVTLVGYKARLVRRRGVHGNRRGDARYGGDDGASGRAGVSGRPILGTRQEIQRSSRHRKGIRSARRWVSFWRAVMS